MDDERMSYLPRVNAYVMHEYVRPGLTKVWVQRLLRDERPCGDDHAVRPLLAVPCPTCRAVL